MFDRLDEWQRVAVAAGGAMFVGMGLGRFSYGAMVPALVQSGQLSADQAGLVGGLNLAGFFVGAFLSEPLRRRLPMRRALAAAAVISLLALVASAVPWGAGWLAFWRALVGIATGLIMVQGLALTTLAAPETRRPVAAGLMFSGVGVGIVFSGVLVPWLLDFGITAAWAGIAAFGAVGTAMAVAGIRKTRPAEEPRDAGPERAAKLRGSRPLLGLAAAYFLFSFGITPHTIYWVDFLVRDVGLAIGAAGGHWAVVGLFAVIGPWAAAWLARRADTAWAVVISFAVLALGVAAPALATAAPVLWLSTMIFGAQPGVSTVSAARARDLGTPGMTPAILRAMIMSSALGGAVGGIVFPVVFAVTGRYDLMFTIAGAGLAIAAIGTLPRRAIR